MGALALVTDSTCDLPQDWIEQHAIEVVPALLIVEGREYADGTGISRSEFYRRLPHWTTPPTTAAPAPGEFALRYEKLLRRGADHVLSIHAARSLTSILEAAHQAAYEFAGRVSLVDSLSLSLGLGFQVLAAAEAAAHGLEAALEAIVSTRERLHVFAALDTMEYLRRSGRVPSAVSLLGSALRIRPLIELRDGRVKVISVARTARQAEERLSAFFKTTGKLERLALLHTGAEERARRFLNGLMQAVASSLPRQIQVVNVTPLIGAHVGPNGLGFAAVQARRVSA